MSGAPLDPARLSGDAKRSYVRDMFTAIAPRYDLLNHLLSLNIDRGWRRRAVARLAWERTPAGTFLDACAGTLDLAAQLAAQPGFTGRVVGADFVVPMLRLGKDKSCDVRPVGADTLRLPFANRTFDGGTVGFGIRNLVDVDAGFRELRRVLKPGARLVVLDFTLPGASPLRALYLFYFRRILPLIGRIVSKHTDAYTYLPDSVLQFPTPEALAGRMTGAGFTDVGYQRLTLGVTAVHWGTSA
ncbi:MAG TPA: ubiquinone/menaquinone biosynthesis methyltransferase [Gemmatimonadales bacterium]|jgi:demethylmenaquinone methyltransferase/2-methoxy-6-polyprenyl-1,4-benzoquinol methylase